MASDVQSDLRHPAILLTAFFAVCLWVGAVARMLEMRGDEWQVGSRSLRLLRAGWFAGWLMFLVHVAAAFHVAHGWSHTAAYEHTERTSGVGEGIFVNYLFGLMWGLDVVWLVGSPGSYARRPRWVGWAVHGFLTFVVFNATVVYGTGFIRWMGVLLFALLGWYSIRRWWTGNHDLARPKGATGNNQW